MEGVSRLKPYRNTNAMWPPICPKLYQEWLQS